MDLGIFALDILKYTLSGLLVIFGAYFLLKSQLDSYYNFKALEYKTLVVKDVLPLKLQAYERLTLFIERINPANLLVRLHISGMSAKEMQNLILAEVRAEYQHNISQQLYITNDSWAIIKRVKDDTVNLVNQSMASLHPEATAIELSKVIFSRFAEVEENPYDLALLVMKNDIQSL
jgi:hypothetical protein